MLIVNQLSGFGGSVVNASLHDILLDLGLTTNLKFCLDAGVAASYISGQKWLDLTANGYDFFRGADGGSSTDDPTFNGLPGERSASEYWSFDGGDFFRLDQANPSWADNLHKDNAKWSAVCAAYPVTAVGDDDGIFGTNGWQAIGTGVAWDFKKPSKTMRVHSRAGSNPPEMINESSLTYNADAWNIAGVSVDEGGGASASVHLVNGSTETFDGAATSPSASAATYTLEIGASGDGGGFPFDNGSRLACLAIWEGTALSGANLLAIRNALKGRFGL